MLIERLKKIRPTFNKIILTADKYEEDVIVNGIVDNTRLKDTLKDIQTVVSVGDDVKCCKPGDKVIFNLKSLGDFRYSDGTKVDWNSLRSDITEIKFYGYKVPTIEIDGKEYLSLFDRNVIFVVEEYEMVESEKPKSNIIVPSKEIIVAR